MGSQWTCGRAVSSGSFAGDGARAAAADRAASRPAAHGAVRLLSDARDATAPWRAGRGPESAPESVGRPPRCRGSQRCGSRPRWRPGTRHVSTAVTHPCHCPLLIQAAVTARLLRTPGGDAGVDGAASCRGEGGGRPPWSPGPPGLQPPALPSGPRVRLGACRPEADRRGRGPLRAWDSPRRPLCRASARAVCCSSSAWKELTRHLESENDFRFGFSLNHQ